MWHVRVNLDFVLDLAALEMQPALFAHFIREELIVLCAPSDHVGWDACVGIPMQTIDTGTLTAAISWVVTRVPVSHVSTERRQLTRPCTDHARALQP